VATVGPGGSARLRKVSLCERAGTTHPGGPVEDGDGDTADPSGSDEPGLEQCPELAANDRTDYQLTSGLFRELVGVRFRLLGFLPTVSGAILTILGALDLSPEVVIGLVIVGLVVTWGLTLYEIRNSQIHDNARPPVAAPRAAPRVPTTAPRSCGAGWCGRTVLRPGAATTKCGSRVEWLAHLEALRGEAGTDPEDS
jgi:hypothetical protein